MTPEEPFKLGRLDGVDWKPVVRGDVYEEEKTSGADRLRIASRSAGASPVSFLAESLKGPFEILYVLHTPRGEAEPGRYQSPELSRAGLEQFFADHHAFFSRDARHDVWIYDTESEGMLIWDRHDIIYAYGPLVDFKKALRKAGYEPGKVEIPDPHSHNYHDAFDAAQAKVLKAFDWRITPLKPEDEQ